MTTREAWLDLASRAEKAKGADREIDVALGVLVPDDYEFWRKPSRVPGRIVAQLRNGNHGTFVCPRYTMSLDAITSLIGEKLPGWHWDVSICRSFMRQDTKAVPHAIVNKPLGDGFNYQQADFSFAATPALALVASFCRAMAERET